MWSLFSTDRFDRIYAGLIGAKLGGMTDLMYLDLCRHRVMTALAAIEVVCAESRDLAAEVAWQSPTAERFRRAASVWRGDVYELSGRVDALTADLLLARARAELVAGSA